MARSFEDILRKAMPWLYLGIVILATVVLTTGAVLVYNQHEDLKMHQRQLALQQVQLNSQQRAQAVLAQRLCQRLSAARIRSNREIREPLRASDHELSILLKGAAAVATSAVGKQQLLAIAALFDQYANHVKIQPPLPCEFAALAKLPPGG